MGICEDLSFPSGAKNLRNPTTQVPEAVPLRVEVAHSNMHFIDHNYHSFPS
jgi:hypothetical protein